MTYRQQKYTELLNELHKLSPSARFYSGRGLLAQLSRPSRANDSDPCSSLQKLPAGTVDFARVLTAEGQVVRVVGVAGANARKEPIPWSGGDGIFVERLRQLRETNPEADWFDSELIDFSAIWSGEYGKLILAGVVEQVCIVGDKQFYGLDLTEERTPRQKFAHQLWRRHGHNPGDQRYGCYTKAMLVKMLAWADAARQHPELFAVLTFGTTPVWFPKAGTYVANFGLVAEGEHFYVKESPEEIAAALS